MQNKRVKRRRGGGAAAPVQSVTTAMRILKALAEGGGAMALKDLAAATA